MTTKHSPGPWITQHGRIYGPEDFRSRHPNRRILIGGVTTDASGWEAMFGATPRDVMQRDIDAEASANANLMAAAPDLLDVCERILEHYSNHLHPEVKAELMDAIRSANGGPMTPHPDRTAVPHPGLYIGLDYRELSLILEALEQYVEERSAPQYARVTRDARALAARLSVDKQRMEEPR